MKPIYNNLLRLAIAAGLTQRELFIEKVSSLLSERTKLDEQEGEKLAESVLSLAESLKDELFLRDLFGTTTGTAAADSNAASAADTAELSKRMDALTESINELTAALKQKS